MIPGNDDALRAIRLFAAASPTRCSAAAACARRQRPKQAEGAEAADRQRSARRPRREPAPSPASASPRRPTAVRPTLQRAGRASPRRRAFMYRYRDGPDLLTAAVRIAGTSSIAFGERQDMATITITAEQVKQLRDKTGAGMMECKAALTEAGGDQEKASSAAQEGPRLRRQARRPRHQQRRRRQLHPHGRQGRRAGRGELRDRLRGAHRRLPDAGEGTGAAHRRRRSAVRAPRGRPGRRAREGEGDLPRAVRRLGQAGDRGREDRRGQAGLLLLAGRAAGPAQRARSRT